MTNLPRPNNPLGDRALPLWPAKNGRLEHRHNVAFETKVGRWNTLAEA